MSIDDKINKKQLLLLEFLLSDKKSFATCYSILDPLYFEAPLDRVVEYVIEYFNKYAGIPSEEIIEAETGIYMVYKELDASEREYLEEEIERHCQTEALSLAILEGADLVNEGKGHEVQELIRQALTVKINRSIGIKLYENAQERVETMGETVVEYSTGIPEVDALIGKIRKRELGLVYAVTGGGKSVMLANIANSLSEQNLNVLIVNLEMSEELYGKRMDAIITGTDIDNHFDNAVNIQEYYDRVKETRGSIVIKRFPAGVPPSILDAYLLEYHLEMGYYPDVFIVDYIGLMGVDGMRGNHNKFDQDEHKAHQIISMCDRYDMVGLSAGQINRDGHDVVKVTPSHCAGGLSLVNASAWAIALVATEEDLDNDLVQVVSLKIRMTKKSRKPLTLFKNPNTLRMSASPNVPNNSDTPINRIKKKVESSEKTEETTKQKLRSALKLSKRA